MNGAFGLTGSNPARQYSDTYRQMLPRGWIDGLTLANDVDAVNDINIVAGVCRSTNNINSSGAASAVTADQRDIEITSTIVKQLDVAWAPGNGGMRSTSSLANTTWHMFAIGGRGMPDDIFAHDSLTPAAVLPTGYTAYRNIGALVRASATILAFVQDGDNFIYAVSFDETVAALAGTTAVLQTLAAIPTGIKLLAKIRANYVIGGNASEVLITSPSASDVAASSGSVAHASLTSAVSSSAADTELELLTDTSARLRYRVSSITGTPVLRITTLGYRHPRGRNS